MSKWLLSVGTSLTLAIPVGALAGAAPGEPLGALTHDRSKRQAWLVRADVLLETRPDARHNPTGAPSALRVAFPLIPDTSTTLRAPTLRRGALATAQGIVDRQPEIVPTDDGSGELVIYEGAIRAGGEIRMFIDVEVVAAATSIDERAARLYDWPTADWGDELRPFLDAQPLVDCDSPEVRSMLEGWTNGLERKVRPYDLAKFIASKVMEEVSVDTKHSRSTSTRRPGQQAEDDEIAPQGASLAARARKANGLDAACLLTALYRAAGLPARLVIAFDHAAPVRFANGSAPDMYLSGDPTIARNICFSGSPEADRLPLTVRAWSEFFLAREPAPGQDDGVGLANGEWIPVDIAAQISYSPSVPPLDRPWTFFGNHPDADEFAPLAFHWNADTGTPTPPEGTWFWNWVGQSHPEVTRSLLQLSAQRMASKVR